MATPQLSPGVLVREVDLTIGRADNVLDNIGAIVGTFALGPIDQPVNVNTEQELINFFGKPYSTDNQYEYWMTASSYLSYGGSLKVVRTDGDTLVNANAIRNSQGISTAGSSELKIKNFEDYEINHSDDLASYVFAAKTPGTWANNLKVCVIDDKADQIIAIGAASTLAQVGYGVTSPISNVPSAGIGTTSIFNGHIKGIITGVNAGTIEVKVISVISSVNNEEIPVDYAQKDLIKSFNTSNIISIVDNTGDLISSATITQVLDWYDEQTLDILNARILWSSVAPKPGTTQYSSDRNSRSDEIHVVVIDDTGTLTGIQGNIVEKHLGLSKASDAISAVNSPQRIWWKNYIAQFSDYLYVGDNVSDNQNPNEPVVQTGFNQGFTSLSNTQGQWNLPAQNKTFSALGNVTYNLSGGVDYSLIGGMKATLGNLVTSYNLFSNKEEIAVDYLIMGPGLDDKIDSQAKANHLISIASLRKDCIAVISPNRSSIVDISNPETQTNNIIEFFSPISSSSYAIFDSGYKYTYDRFNNRFRYIPCNGDIAGLMVRTSIFAFPWFSPAGQQRGIINNAIKLAYNPNKAQRDRLYPQRINAIINQPGLGVLLFGDKTALAYASAFDRINVRRLFLTVEQALERTAQAQLFELNNEVTRANFVNIVEPYLRDIQAKGGVFDFLIKCDDNNNTPEVIDNNEFRADIFLKPTKSINYVTLTFVATRTGISFEEVAGTV